MIISLHINKMNTSPLDQNVQSSIRSNWNAFASAYDRYMHEYLLQGFNTLAIHTQAHLKNNILEVGSGSGMHTLCFA
jgi:hypothetical protein